MHVYTTPGSLIENRRCILEPGTRLPECFIVVAAESYQSRLFLVITFIFKFNYYLMCIILQTQLINTLYLRGSGGGPNAAGS